MPSFTAACSAAKEDLQCLVTQLHLALAGLICSAYLHNCMYVAQPGRFTEPSYTAACTVALAGRIHGIQLNGCIEHCQIRCTVPSTAACSTA